MPIADSVQRLFFLLSVIDFFDFTNVHKLKIL